MPPHPVVGSTLLLYMLLIAFLLLFLIAVWVQGHLHHIDTENWPSTQKMERRVLMVSHLELGPSDFISTHVLTHPVTRVPEKCSNQRHVVCPAPSFFRLRCDPLIKQPARHKDATRGCPESSECGFEGEKLTMFHSGPILVPPRKHRTNSDG